MGKVLEEERKKLKYMGLGHLYFLRDAINLEILLKESRLDEWIKLRGANK